MVFAVVVLGLFVAPKMLIPGKVTTAKATATFTAASAVGLVVHNVQVIGVVGTLNVEWPEQLRDFLRLCQVRCVALLTKTVFDSFNLFQSLSGPYLGGGEFWRGLYSRKLGISPVYCQHTDFPSSCGVALYQLLHRQTPSSQTSMGFPQDPQCYRLLLAGLLKKQLFFFNERQKEHSKGH